MSVIHIIEEPSEVEVWLDTEIAECDGLVIGVAATREAAIADAIADLEGALRTLRDTKAIGLLRGMVGLIQLIQDREPDLLQNQRYVDAMAFLDNHGGAMTKP